MVLYNQFELKYLGYDGDTGTLYKNEVLILLNLKHRHNLTLIPSFISVKAKNWDRCKLYAHLYLSPYLENRPVSEIFFFIIALLPSSEDAASKYIFE